MNRSFFFLLFGFTVMMALAGCNQQKAPKPNILFIISDDHTYQAIGAYQSRFAGLDPTPAIDRLAEEGMIFNRVFCVNSICTPSRANILTGQHSHINKVRDLYDPLPVQAHYLPIELNKAGYQTAAVGKWHLRRSPESFDYYNVLPGQGKYYDPVLYSRDEGELKDVRIDSKLTRKLRVKEYQGHSSDVLTDVTIDWLKNKREKDKPFFLMHGFKAPHDMFRYAKRYEDYMEDVDFPEPATQYEPEWGSVATRGKHDSLIDYIGSSIGKRNKIRNMGMHMGIPDSLPAGEYWKKAYQEYMKRYFRCVKGVDDNVQRIFEYLEEEGLMDNTIIIYTSDQGFFLGEHDFIDKRWMYEEAFRMPLLIRYPGMIDQGSKNDWLINNTDFAPTILEMAGVETPWYMQGRSFYRALRGEQEPDTWRKATYYRYWMHMAHAHNNPAHFGIRTKRYKLILFYGTDFIKTGREQRDGNRFRANTPVAWEMYDLEKDPHETQNIYEEMKGSDKVKELKSLLKELRVKIGDTDYEYPQIKKIIENNWDK